MSDLKTQLRNLIAAKEYRAAIMLIEQSTLPDKDTYIERIRARLAAETAKPAPVPVKPARAFRVTCAYAAAIVVVTLGVLLAVTLLVTNPRRVAQYGVAFYCGLVLDRTDCKDYTAAVMAQSEATVMACYRDWEFPKYDASFYRCLKDNGIE